jgi:hypothetical protein
MEPGTICSSCASPLSKSFDRTCTRCGWDNQVGMRKCVKCRGGAVSLHEPIGNGPISGGIGIGGILFWGILRSAFVWVILCAVGSLCGLFTMATLGYKCGTCGKRADSRFLSVEEKRSSWLRRLAYLIGAILLAVAALLLAALIAGRY